jgi:hypothetical protein
MADIFFDNATKDIVLENGDLKLTSDVDVSEGIRQDMIAQLQTFQGEYFIDEVGNQVGVPWLQEIFQVKPLPLEKTDRLIRNTLLSVEGVATVNELKLGFETGDRGLLIDFICETDDGVLISDNIQIG